MKFLICISFSILSGLLVFSFIHVWNSNKEVVEARKEIVKLNSTIEYNEMNAQLSDRLIAQQRELIKLLEERNGIKPASSSVFGIQEALEGR